MRHNPIMLSDGQFHELENLLYGEESQGCECELDWNCGRHPYTETPEDRIATWWSQDHP